jgi:hypothetical protein
MGAWKCLGPNLPPERETARLAASRRKPSEEVERGSVGRKVFRSVLPFLLNGKEHPRSTPTAKPYCIRVMTHFARWAHGTSRDSAVIRRLPGALTPNTLFCIITGPWADDETQDKTPTTFLIARCPLLIVRVGTPYLWRRASPRLGHSLGLSREVFFLSPQGIQRLTKWAQTRGSSPTGVPVCSPIPDAGTKTRLCRAPRVQLLAGGLAVGRGQIPVEWLPHTSQTSIHSQSAAGL